MVTPERDDKDVKVREFREDATLRADLGRKQRKRSDRISVPKKVLRLQLRVPGIVRVELMVCKDTKDVRRNKSKFPALVG